MSFASGLLSFIQPASRSYQLVSTGSLQRTAEGREMAWGFSSAEKTRPVASHWLMEGRRP
jgi:hypothetical protein